MRSGARPRALATAPLRGDGLDTLNRLCDVTYDPWIDHYPIRIYSSDHLAERVIAEDARVLIVESDLVGEAVFDAPLTAVACTRGDPSNVDVAAATRAGVPVLYTPGRNADAVAELTVGLLFSTARHLVQVDREIRRGETWRDGTIPYQRHRTWELQGRTAGLVGLGAVGKAVRWRLQALGMRVVSHDPYNREADCALEELLAASDVVSMHAAVTAETAGMIGREQFAEMRDGVIFLNAARAQLHDIDALVDALRDGKVAAAGLDHFVGEDLPVEHPLVAMANVVLTPHIGGATYDTEVRHTRMVADDIDRLMQGNPPVHCANPEVLGV